MLFYCLFLLIGNVNDAHVVPVRRQVQLSESKTANLPRMAPIGEVLTLTLGTGRIVEPSVAFPWRTQWSVKYIPRK